MATRNLIPRGSGEGGLGIETRPWGTAFFDSGNFTSGITVGGNPVPTGFDIGGGGGAVIEGDDDNINFGGTDPADTRDINFMQGGENVMIINEEGNVNIENNMNVSGTISGVTGIFDDRVGIGTTSPDETLHVSSAAGPLVAILEHTDGASSELAFKDLEQQNDIRIGTADSGFRVFTADEERMRIDSDGNVGIGTTNPGAKLHVDLGGTGTIAEFRGADTDLLHIDGDSNQITLDARNVGALAFEMQGSEAMRINSDGNVGIGTTNPGAKLIIEESSSDVVTRYRANNNYAGQIIGKTSGVFSLNGRLGLDFNLTGDQNSAMRITSTGKVGIGTTSPGAKLDVRGLVSSSGMIRATGWFSGNISDHGIGCEIGVITYDSNVTGLVMTYERSSSSYRNTLIQSGDTWVHLKSVGENTLDLEAATINLRQRNNTATSDTTVNIMGNVGIGTTSPAAKLTIPQTSTIAGINLSNACILAGSTSTGIGIDDNEIIKRQGANGGQLNIGSQGADASIKFKTGADTANGDIPFDRMIIDSDGNVGIGTTNPGDKLDIVSDFNNWGITVTNPTANPARLSLTNTEGSATIDCNNGLLRLGNNTSQDLVIDSNGNVGIGTASPGAKLDVLGDIVAAGSNISVTNGGSASGVGMYSPASNEMGLCVNSNEAIRIDSNGNVGIGTTDPSSIVSASTALNAFAYVKTGGHADFTSNSIGPGIYINKTNATTSQATDYINFRNKGSKVGGIEYDGIDVVFDQTSDVRLKTNIKDSESGLNVVNGLRVRSFNWINDSRRSKRFGFVAQEMQEVFEDAVKVGGEDENEDPWGIYDTKLIPILTKAIQEQQQIIEDLKSRIVALEGGSPEPDKAEEPAVKEVSEESNETVSLGTNSSVSSTSLDELKDLRAEETVSLGANVSLGASVSSTNLDEIKDLRAEETVSLGANVSLGASVSSTSLDELKDLRAEETVSLGANVSLGARVSSTNLDELKDLRAEETNE